LTYYKRGTVYLALGKAKFALLDLDRVLELKADFTSARLQRGNILLKQAQFDEAEIDFLDVVCYFFTFMLLIPYIFFTYYLYRNIFIIPIIISALCRRKYRCLECLG